MYQILRPLWYCEKHCQFSNIQISFKPFENWVDSVLGLLRHDWEILEKKTEVNSSIENCKNKFKLTWWYQLDFWSCKRNLTGWNTGFSIIFLDQTNFICQNKNGIYLKKEDLAGKKKVAMERKRSRWKEKDLARSKKILRQVKRSSLAKQKDFAQRVIWIFTSKMTFIVHSK